MESATSIGTRPQSGNLTVALAGNPNIGKTTLFNALTGLSQHVGNWPGKTIEQATGTCRFGSNTMTLVDLPGTYSLLGGTPEELIARDYIRSGAADVLVVLADATNLERNLYLVCQAIALTTRVVVALNMMDDVKRRGWHIDTDRLEHLLEVPVVPISARRRQGLDRLLTRVVAVASGEGVRTATATTALGPGESDRERAAADLYQRAAAITREVLKQAPARPDPGDRADAIITHRFWAFPMMLAVFAVIFSITMFGAEPLAKLFELLFTTLARQADQLLLTLGVGELVRSAVVDGLFTGVGSVVAVMLPTMSIFFVLFALLEDSGFIPRIAFNMDRPMQAVGSQGKHCLSCLMGFGCNIPGVMSTRIMDGSHRLIAIITNSLVPCNGRLGVMLPIALVFFGRSAPLVMLGLLALSMAVVMAASFVLSRTLFRGHGPGFVLELPPYRCPDFGRVIVRALREKVMHVLIRAAAIAAPITLLIWMLSNFPLGAPPDLTLTGRLVGFLDAPARLIGLDGQILTSALFAFPAKEIVIGTLAMTTGLTTSLEDAGVLEHLAVHWSGFTALNFLVFFTFFLPCAYTIVVIYRETRSIRLTLWGIAVPLLVSILLCWLLFTGARLIGLA